MSSHVEQHADEPYVWGGAGATGAELIAAERERQVNAEGWTPEHDRHHEWDELARAAVTYATPPRIRRVYADTGLPLTWPWDLQFWKPTPDDRVHEMVKAGALIAAEIDRLLTRS